MDNDINNISDSSAEAETSDSAVSNQKKYYGTSFLILLVCNFIYMIPHFEHYMMGGMQGLIILVFLAVIMLIIDVVCMFILAAILRRVMKKSWAGRFRNIAMCALLIVTLINIYRASLPLPYLQYMIDRIPDAVSYFETHEAEFNADIKSGKQDMFFYNEGTPAGPMVNMQYVYVESAEKYPKQTGQIDRITYIHPLNEHWYLFLHQRYAY